MHLALESPIFRRAADRPHSDFPDEVHRRRSPDDGVIIEKIPQQAVGDAVFLNVLPLRQLAAILSSVSVYVANDSGPMYIAVAVGTKTVGIFGPGEVFEEIRKRL